MGAVPAKAEVRERSVEMPEKRWIDLTLQEFLNIGAVQVPGKASGRASRDALTGAEAASAEELDVLASMGSPHIRFGLPGAIN
jgi:hypothetical protein